MSVLAAPTLIGIDPMATLTAGLAALAAGAPTPPTVTAVGHIAGAEQAIATIAGSETDLP